jgi:hypothetical protein
MFSTKTSECPSETNSGDSNKQHREHARKRSLAMPNPHPIPGAARLAILPSITGSRGEKTLAVDN